MCYRALVSASEISSDLAGKAFGGRKLIAVVYADMVGYSRLISLDDAGTLRRLRTLRRALIDPAISEHGGRVVQTGGDSLLMAFDSIDGAVRCAVTVQQQVPVYDGDQPPDRRIRFRVGINTGDVIPDGTDLHGDGVNIAARLQAECPAGGICVSRAVRDQVHGGLDLAFESIGPLTLKNIARPVEAFVLRLDPAAQQPSAKGAPAGPRARLTQTRLLAGLVGLLLVVAGGTGWWLHRGAGSIPHTTQASSTSPSATSQAYAPPSTGLNAPRLSMVVLPFKNLGGDPKEDYLAEGITEDITTDLSRVPGMFVIARESAYTYQGNAVDVHKVGEELGVRYALEGSVRKAGDALRANAQLISTETGAHLWAERFDQNLSNLGAGQEEIVYRIGQTLNVALTDLEGARSQRERPTNPDAYDLILRARSIRLHPMATEQHQQVISLLEQALRLDPNSIYALTGLAHQLLIGMTRGTDSGDDDERADQLIAAAEAISPNNEYVLFELAFRHYAHRRNAECVTAFQRLLDVDSNSAFANYIMSFCLTYLGRSEEAVARIEKALRLNPLAPDIDILHWVLGRALLFLGRDEEATVWLQRALSETRTSNSHAVYLYSLFLAAAYVHLGHFDEAHRALAVVNRNFPYATIRMIAPAAAPNGPANSVYVGQVKRYQEGLRLAGLRDHAEEDADFHVPADNNLRVIGESAGWTPTTVAGATTIYTAALKQLLAGRRPIVIDTLLNSWGRSIPGAIGLERAGLGGSTSDGLQDRLRKKMQELTKGDLATPIVAVGFNSERFDGHHLAVRLVALGYTQVYWYRGGREAWEVAGLPENQVDLQDW
jgi:TolB-like protein/class 3 adenylate cyclase